MHEWAQQVRCILEVQQADIDDPQVARAYLPAMIAEIKRPHVRDAMPKTSLRAALNYLQGLGVVRLSPVEAASRAANQAEIPSLTLEALAREVNLSGGVDDPSRHTAW